MTALFAIGCIAAYLAVYFWIGFAKVAPRYITRKVEQHCREWPGLTGPRELERERRNAAGDAGMAGFFWPAYLLTTWIGRSIAAASPLITLEMKRELERRDRRIRDLERELGIGGDR